jgi:hypothetical protein
LFLGSSSNKLIIRGPGEEGRAVSC